jgi:hypothetical protein
VKDRISPGIDVAFGVGCLVLAGTVVLVGIEVGCGVSAGTEVLVGVGVGWGVSVAAAMPAGCSMLVGVTPGIVGTAAAVAARVTWRVNCAARRMFSVARAALVASAP